MNLIAASVISTLASVVLALIRTRRQLIRFAGAEIYEICSWSVSFALLAAMIVFLERAPFSQWQGW
jgi:hypothetical protein